MMITSIQSKFSKYVSLMMCCPRIRNESFPYTSIFNMKKFNRRHSGRLSYRTNMGGEEASKTSVKKTDRRIYD